MAGPGGRQGSEEREGKGEGERERKRESMCVCVVITAERQNPGSPQQCRPSICRVGRQPRVEGPMLCRQKCQMVGLGGLFVAWLPRARRFLGLWRMSLGVVAVDVFCVYGGWGGLFLHISECISLLDFYSLLKKLIIKV